MEIVLTIFRWVVAIPAALLGSDFCGMLLAFLTWGIRHLGGKLFGDAIDDKLQKPFTIIDNFFVGVLFVVFGVLIAPVHNFAVIIGMAAVKAWLDYQRGCGTFQAVSSTWGGIVAAIVLACIQL